MNKEELLVSLCQEAIRIPSMSGHEKEVAGLLKKTMIDYGFDEVNITEAFWASSMAAVLERQS